MTCATYDDYLATKLQHVPSAGVDVDDFSPQMFPFQHDLTRWALRRGRAAIFADCGLGKTFMELEWARHIPGKVLILAPLAVAQQIESEADKFGVPARYRRSPHDDAITITNYEILHHFDPDEYTGVVLDESSILKSLDGKTRQALTDRFRATPYKLCATATPAPNDHMELGNHAEFLGAMTRAEMLAMFFVHDGGSTQRWRLKGHAQEPFWMWVASWAAVLRFPHDLGYEDNGFVLPSLDIREHIIRSTAIPEGHLLPVRAASLSERIAARRASVAERVAKMAEIVAAGNASDPWVLWCNLNSESAALVEAIPDAVEVRGSQSAEAKERALLGFTHGDIRILVTKPTIAGHGMNWQHCARVGFVGLSDSWEQWYQAIRRCWRFGQTRPVNVDVVVADTEGAVLANIKKKERDAEVLYDDLVQHTATIVKGELRGMSRTEAMYERDVRSGQDWTLYLGDCVDVLRDMDDASVHYSIFSPPFASLYTYTNSLRDMGNVRNNEEFFQHFRFMVQELYRVLLPGRLVSFHCMNLPTSKVRDGVIGQRDFRGELIHLFSVLGFIFHSEVCIWKDPVTAMQRTKALGLLYKQLKKDSAMSRQGIPDYVVTMRKPGENPEPVSHTPADFPLPVWQQYASPIWTDINQSDTLTYREAREHDDERHIAPLQLTVIRRCLRLWSNPGDLVLSPFAGIGSEGYVALEEGRRFVGAELKRSYWEAACRNLASVRRYDLFSQEESA